MRAPLPPLGHVALVLHAHLPYVRHPEHERSLEERWLHEAVWETYLPLVEMLDRLEADGIVAPFSMTVSPPLAAMWCDGMLRERARAHLVRTRALALHLSRRYRGGPFEAALAHHVGLLDRAEATLDRHGGDVLGALVHHHRGGRLHLFTTTATHAFLPGLAPDPAWARAQIRIGRAAFRSMTGIDPHGLWLPECAFASWLDPILGGEGESVGFTALDAHGVALAAPRPPVVTIPQAPGTHPSSKGPLTVPPMGIRSAAGVAYFGRDLWAGRSVWAMDGYPSDPEYREFHHDVGFDLDESELLGEVGPYGARVATGLKLHRITGGPGEKQPYSPEAARAKARSHARQFVADRTRLFATLRGAAAAREAHGTPGATGAHGTSGASGPHDASGAARGPLGLTAPPLSMVPFDAELFGHFWHEGVVFLEEVLRLLHASGRSGGAEAVSLAEREERYPATLRAQPAESTWGEGGFSETWTGKRTAALWRHVHHADRATQACAQRARREIRASTQTLALNQAIIQTLLLQSSDFPFMIHQGTTVQYANLRIAEHAANVRRLLTLAEAPEMSDADRGWITANQGRTPFLRDLPGEILRSALEEG